jgi:hypothetical protein
MAVKEVSSVKPLSLGELSSIKPVDFRGKEVRIEKKVEKTESTTTTYQNQGLDLEEGKDEKISNG